MTNNFDIYDDWCKYIDYLGCTMNPFQKYAVKRLLKFPKISTLRWTRGAGKTWLLGKLGFFLPYRLGWTTVIGTPKDKQKGEIMREAREACQAILPSKGAFISAKKIEIKGSTGRILAVPIGPTSYKSAQSLHCEVGILDEMQALEAEHVAESFIGMVAPSKGCMWFTGLGGSPISASHVFGKRPGFHYKVNYKKYLKYDPEYIEFVKLARATMPPAEFDAHYRCKGLDMSDHKLVPSIQPIIKPMYNPTTLICIDWGKRRDETIVLVVDRTQSEETGKHLFHVVDFGVFLGSYTEQGEQIASWLIDVPFDEIRTENNGVGDAATDIIKKEIYAKDPRANIKDVWVAGGWKNKMLHKLFNLAKDGDLRYDEKNPKALRFYNDITGVNYRMLKLSTMDADHSDYISSLLLALDIPGEVYL